MSKKIDKWSMDQSNLKPEVISVKCSICGTIYTIVTNTVGCFYCPTCNITGTTWVGGTEDFSYGNET